MKPPNVIAVFTWLVLGGAASSIAGAEQYGTSQPSAGSAAPSSEALRAQYVAHMEQASHDQQEMHKRNIALLEKMSRDQEDAHKLNMALMARLEALITRQEKDVARYEKILDGWEHQQAAYQKYLDTLPKR